MAKLSYKLIKVLRGLARRKRKPAFTYSTVRRVESMTDVPDKLGSEIVLVLRKNVAQWAVFMCPCGCGQRLNVNLMRSAEPHWLMSMRRGKVSLSPSLWATEKCGSHFWLVNNGIFWCWERNAGPRPKQ